MIKAELSYHGHDTKSKKKSRGKIILKAEAVQASNHEVKMSVVCDIQTKENKGFLCFCKGATDRPYLVIEREMQADDETRESWV